MRAVRQHTFGGPERLAVEELADLEPSAMQVRVRVEAAGVHLLDTSIREGESGPFGIATLPMTPGREVAGTVDAVGRGVEDASASGWLGRRVVVHLGAASGGYASQAVAPVDALIAIEADVDAAEAVAMVGTGRTALGILDEAQPGAGDVVIVTAAAGGLGTLLVQAASNAGCLVVGVAGGPAKVELVRSLGADIAVDYLVEGWVEEVRSTLGDRMINVALDGVGGAIGRAAFDLVAPGGRMVLFGYTEGTPMDLSTPDLFAHGVSVTPAIGPRMFARPGGIQGLAREAVERLERGEWRPVVDRFGLERAADAHAALEARRTTGKVVLIP